VDDFLRVDPRRSGTTTKIRAGSGEGKRRAYTALTWAKLLTDVQ
jgi:hypothetical protein